MAAESTIISRYEAKYLVSERIAKAVRDSIQGFCSPDEYVDSDGRYMVNNLYFDTNDLRFYFDTRFKRFTRFKPRLRFYGTHPKDYLWVELKHKHKNVTWKIRRRVASEEWPRLLDEPVSITQHTRSLNIKDSFEDVVMRFQARPILHVRYIREPYVSDLDDYGRITFDRHLSFRPANGSFDLTATSDMTYFDDSVTTVCPFDESPVILEIKTEMCVPAWVVRLIRCFDLSQRGFSKYCSGIDTLMLTAQPNHRVSVLT